MATYTKGLSVSAAVAAGPGAGTLYTCPANSYAILNLHLGTPATDSVTVGGISVYVGAAITTNIKDNYMSSIIYVGPGQSVVAAGIVSISGVQFTNQA